MSRGVTRWATPPRKLSNACFRMHRPHFQERSRCGLGGRCVWLTAHFMQNTAASWKFLWNSLRIHKTFTSAKNKVACSRLVHHCTKTRYGWKYFHCTLLFGCSSKRRIKWMLVCKIRLNGDDESVCLYVGNIFSTCHRCERKNFAKTSWALYWRKHRFNFRCRRCWNSFIDTAQIKTYSDYFVDWQLFCLKNNFY